MISCETSINCSKIIRDALTQPGASGSSSFSPSEPADLPAYVQLLETKRIHWNNVDRDLVRQAFDKFVKTDTNQRAQFSPEARQFVKATPVVKSGTLWNGSGACCEKQGAAVFRQAK